MWNIFSILKYFVLIEFVLLQCDYDLHKLIFVSDKVQYPRSVSHLAFTQNDFVLRFDI